MYDFEHRLAQARQKKVTDIAPPLKSRAGQAPPQKQRAALLKGASPAKKAPLRSQSPAESRKKPPVPKKETQKIEGLKLLSAGPAVVKKLSAGIGQGKTIVPRLRGVKLPSPKPLAFIAAGVALLGGGIFVFLELPRVRVVLHPIVQSHAFELSFEGRTDIADVDAEKGLVPAQLLSFTVEYEQEFPASGTEEKIDKAQGVITVYNAYSSEPQVLVERTRFVAESGRLFRTKKRIVVPGAKVEGGNITPSSIDVEVVADEAGSDYNIGPSTFSIPGFAGTPRYLGFYGKSKHPMEGGFVGEVTVVSREDLTEGVQKVEEALFAKADGELKEKIPSGFSLLGTPVTKILSMTSSKEAQEAGDRFKIGGVMEVKVFAVRDSDLEKLIARAADMSIPALMQEIPSLRQVEQSVTSADTAGEVIRGDIAVETKIMYELDTGALAQSLWGKNSEEAQAVLYADQRIMKAVVSFWPVWVSDVPKDLSRIKIEVALPQTADR